MIIVFTIIEMWNTAYSPHTLCNKKYSNDWFLIFAETSSKPGIE